MYKAIALGIICAFGAVSQTGVPKEPSGTKQVIVQSSDPTQFGPVGVTAALAGPMATVSGAPYSAQVVTQRVQTLADGNRIEQTTAGSVARDSQGRVRREEPLPPGFPSPDGNGPRLIRIEDPVAGVHWTLDTHTKTAIKMPFAPAAALSKPGVSVAQLPPLPPPPPVGGERTFFFVSAPGPGMMGATQTVTKASSGDSNVTQTDLGTQTIEGVSAQGTRLTRILPAGSVGNEQPITITTETWQSPELKVLIMSRTNDPRIGETTYKLTNIQRSEPAADLFQVPPDYTEKTQPTNMLIYREGNKQQ